MPHSSRLRRFGAAIVAVTAVSLALAACTSSVSAEKPSSAPAASEAAATGPYTVKHAMGETELKEVPHRIVVIDSPHLDALVTLGIEPVGAAVASAGASFPDYLADKLKNTKQVGLIAEPDVEAIAALNPDLIIGAKVRHEAIYKELSAIAPTVFSVDSGTDWHEQALITAAAVNQTPAMEKAIAAIDTRAAEVGAKVGAKDKTASIVRFRTENFRLYGPESFSGSLLTKVGFNLGSEGWNKYSMQELSPEQFEKINGDVIFYTSPGGDPKATTQDAITKLWTSLPAVASGKAFEVADSTWMVGIGVTGAGVVLDQIAQKLG